MSTVWREKFQLPPAPQSDFTRLQLSQERRMVGQDSKLTLGGGNDDRLGLGLAVSRRHPPDADRAGAVERLSAASI